MTLADGLSTEAASFCAPLTSVEDRRRAPMSDWIRQ